MDNNDDLQNRLNRIGQWEIFDLDWGHIRQLAVLNLVNLCALSVGINPEYARLVMEMTAIDPYDLPKSEELAEMAAYRNDKITELKGRLKVAMNHVNAGSLQIVRKTAPLGGHDPFATRSEDPEEIEVRVADFVTWASSRPTPWEMPDEMKRMGPYPESEEGLQQGQATLTNSERDKLLKHIAALSLALAEKSNRYTRGEAPNASQIADAVAEILDALPDANKRGLGNSSVRESISQGLALLTK